MLINVRLNLITQGEGVAMMKETICTTIFVLILFSLLAAGCSTNSAATRRADICPEACGRRVRKAGPDVAADWKVPPVVQKRWDIFNDEPTAKLFYQGTTGYVTQYMQAIARVPNCPLGAAVVLKRPDPEYDTMFNKDCCPPGLHFAGPNSTTIEGTPTRSGQFTTTVLLCGQCKTGNPSNWYPIVGKIKWIIKGRLPKRIE